MSAEGATTKQRKVNQVKIAKFLALFVLALFVSLITVQAAPDTNFPSVGGLLDPIGTHFNTALGWVIGATAVLIAIRWIKKAASR